MTNPDLVYADKYPESRYGPKAINIMIESIYKETYDSDIEMTQYGKPYKSTYDFAEEFVREQLEGTNVEISNFYMIGDNPKSDIAGGNARNWNTLLVKTGVFDATVQANDKEHPATHVVEDFKGAIDLIFKKE